MSIIGVRVTFLLKLDDDADTGKAIEGDSIGAATDAAGIVGC